MEKNGEFREENETKPAKEVQKEVYTPIEKEAGDINPFRVIEELKQSNSMAREELLKMHSWDHLKAK